VHVISKARLRDFWETHPGAQRPLLAWYRRVLKAQWKGFQAMKADYPTADHVGKCTVFDIGGNKWRIITAIHYNRQKVFIGAVLTDEEYDRRRWQQEC
jgi:mRNA interferase HigB